MVCPAVLHPNNHGSSPSTAIRASTISAAASASRMIRYRSCPLESCISVSPINVVLNWFEELKQRVPVQ